MNIELQVLASCLIKRKKPWCKVTWLGKEKEDLLLLDKQRFSLLYLPSGRTQKRIGSVNSLLNGAVSFGISAAGLHLVALLPSGNIVLWYKDFDTAYTVQGLPEFKSSPLTRQKDKKKLSFPLPDVFVSSEAKEIIVILGKSKIYLWQSFVGTTENVNPTNQWCCIKNDSQLLLPSLDCKDTVLQVVFSDPSTWTHSAITCAFIFSNGDSVCTTFCLLKINIYGIFTATWKQRDVSVTDLGPEYQAVHRKGALIARLTQDGQLLAVVVNQSHGRNKLLFISPETGACDVIQLQYGGACRSVNNNRSFTWISDMTWTTDNTLLVCITQHGALCMISRLGCHLQISTTGCSQNVGPSFYLKLYPQDVMNAKIPVLFRETDIQDDSETSLSQEATVRQMFSVSAHPGTPLLVVCNGYLVKGFQLPELVSSSVNFIRSLCLLSQETLTPLLHEYLPESEGAIPDLPIHSLYRPNKCERVYPVSETSPIPPVDDDLFGPMKRVYSGEIGSTTELSEMDIDTGTSFVSWEHHSLSLIGTALLTAWGIASSVNDCWSQELEILCQSVVWMLLQTMMIALNERFVISSRIGSNQCDSPVVSVLNLLYKFLGLVKFDHLHFNILPSIVKLVNCSCRMLLTSASLNVQVPRFQVLRDVSDLLLSAENMFKRVHMYSICLSTGFEFAGGLSYNSRTSDLGSQLIRRVQKSWHLLYKYAVQHYKTSLGKSPQASQLLCTVQRSLQDRGYEMKCCEMKIKRRNNGTLLYLSGHKRKALQIWLRKAKKQGVLTSQAMHRIFYALLLQGDVMGAVKFAYIVMSNQPRRCLKKQLPETVFQLVEGLDKSEVQTLVASLTRLMAAYFTNSPVLVYPVTNPKPLPSQLANSHVAGDRLVPTSSQFLTMRISEQRLESLIVPNMVLEMILLNGLWAEAIDFALKLGHWKMAYLLAILELKLFGERDCHLELLPKSIIISQLKNLVQFDEEKNPCVSQAVGSSEEERNRCVEDIQKLLLPALICEIDAVPILFCSLLEKLKSMLTGLTLLVPQDIYLPAPPIFCPQPFVGCEANDMPEKNSEAYSRHSTAKVIQDIFCVIQAANLDAYLLACYMSFLEKIWSALDLDLEGLASLDHLTSICHGGSSQFWNNAKNCLGLQQCIQGLRELCSLLWFLTCRDNLSLACRNLQAYMLSCRNRLDKSRSVHQSLCYEVIQWAGCILPFQQYLFSSDSLHALILNTVWDLPPSSNVVQCVAKIFLDATVSNSVMKQRFAELQERWSSYPEQQSQHDEHYSESKKNTKKRNPSGSVMFIRTINEKKLNRQIYDDVVTNLIKTELQHDILKFSYDQCEFETNVFYVEFLESIFQIGILKHLQPDLKPVPFLVTFSKELKENNLLDYSSSLQVLKTCEKPALIFKLPQLFVKDSIPSGTSTRQRESLLLCKRSRSNKRPHFIVRANNVKLKKRNNHRNLKKWKSMAAILTSTRQISKKISKSASTINLTSLSTSSPKKESPEFQHRLRVMADLLPHRLKPLVNLYAWIHQWFWGKTGFWSNETASHSLVPLTPSVVLFLMLRSDHHGTASADTQKVKNLGERFTNALLDAEEKSSNTTIGEPKTQVVEWATPKKYVRRKEPEVSLEYLPGKGQYSSPKRTPSKISQSSPIAEPKTEVTEITIPKTYVRRKDPEVQLSEKSDSQYSLPERAPTRISGTAEVVSNLDESDQWKIRKLDEELKQKRHEERVDNQPVFIEDDQKNVYRLLSTKENKNRREGIPPWSRFYLPQVYLERWHNPTLSHTFQDVSPLEEINLVDENVVTRKKSHVQTSGSNQNPVIYFNPTGFLPRASQMEESMHPTSAFVSSPKGNDFDSSSVMSFDSQDNKADESKTAEESRTNSGKSIHNKTLSANENERKQMDLNLTNSELCVEGNTLASPNANKRLAIFHDAFRAELQKMAEQLSLDVGGILGDIARKSLSVISTFGSSVPATTQSRAEVSTQTSKEIQTIPTRTSHEVPVTCDETRFMEPSSEDSVTDISSEKNTLNSLNLPEHPTDVYPLFSHETKGKFISELPLLKLNVPPELPSLILPLEQELIGNNMDVTSQKYNKCPDKFTMDAIRKIERPVLLLRLEETKSSTNTGSIVSPEKVKKYLQGYRETPSLEPVHEYFQMKEHTGINFPNKLLHLQHEDACINKRVKSSTVSRRLARTRRKEKVKPNTAAEIKEEQEPTVTSLLKETRTFAKTEEPMVEIDDRTFLKSFLPSSKVQRDILEVPQQVPVLNVERGNVDTNQAPKIDQYESYVDIQSKVQNIVYKDRIKQTTDSSTQAEYSVNDANVDIPKAFSLDAYNVIPSNTVRSEVATQTAEAVQSPKSLEITSPSRVLSDASVQITEAEFTCSSPRIVHSTTTVAKEVEDNNVARPPVSYSKDNNMARPPVSYSTLRKEKSGNSNMKQHLANKLDEMQSQIQAIEKVSTNVEREFINASGILKEAEMLSSKHKEDSTFDVVPFKIALDEDEFQEKNEKENLGNRYRRNDLHKARRRQSQQQMNFEQRKRAILDMITDDASVPRLNKTQSVPAVIANQQVNRPSPGILMNRTQTLTSGRKRISFGSTETIFVPSSNSREHLNRTFKVARQGNDSVPISEASQNQHLKDAYSDLRSTSTDKRSAEDDESVHSSDTNSPWEVPHEIHRILYDGGNEQIPVQENEVSSDSIESELESVV